MAVYPHVHWFLEFRKHKTRSSVSFACQCRTVTQNMRTAFFFIHALSTVRRCLNIREIRAVWPVSRPIATLNFGLLTARSSFRLLGRNICVHTQTHTHTHTHAHTLVYLYLNQTDVFSSYTSSLNVKE